MKALCDGRVFKGWVYRDGWMDGLDDRECDVFDVGEVR